MEDRGEPTRRTPAGGSLAATWLGHATVLIELDGARLLTDPVLGARVGPLRRVALPVAPAATKEIDAVLLSHLHADHADARSLRSIGTGTPVLAPAGAGGWLRGRGFRDVRELRPGEETSVAGVSVRATPASHPPGRWRARPGASPIGFVARGSQSAYFAGDTDLFDEMETLAGTIQLALLPVAGWGPTVGPGHLDPIRAAEAARRIGPRVAVPIHWGTLAAPWPIRSPGRDRAAAVLFAEEVSRRARGVEVRVLAPGERAQLSARCGGPLDVPA
jgi:L-ascorbate metabolism protein UlaG (beta-lactamase superfamily)